MSKGLVAAVSSGIFCLVIQLSSLGILSESQAHIWARKGLPEPIRIIAGLKQGNNLSAFLFLLFCYNVGDYLCGGIEVKETVNYSRMLTTCPTGYRPRHTTKYDQ